MPAIGTAPEGIDAKHCADRERMVEVGEQLTPA